LINDPTVINNVFYLSIPGKTGGALYWIVFVFGILATVRILTYYSNEVS